jgi:hypothetical protein
MDSTENKPVDPLLFRQMQQSSGASVRDVETAFDVAAEQVSSLHNSKAHFELLVVSRARLLLYKKALNGMWPQVTVH